jgi:hypothetical protein
MVETTTDDRPSNRAILKAKWKMGLRQTGIFMTYTISFHAMYSPGAMKSKQRMQLLIK